MRYRFATAAAWTLACLVGITVSAQTSNQDGKSDSQKSDSQQQKDAGQGQTEKIRGELAGVSVVGETMVDYSTGRGVVAEFTYLTILGSPADGGRQGGANGRSDSGRDANQTSKSDDNSGSSKNDLGSNQGQARGDQGGQGRSGGGAANRRRSVYQIAVGPDTQVHNRTPRNGGSSGDQKAEHGDSAREKSKAEFERLQLGDRVEVEFTRMNAGSQSGGGDQGGSANASRHGRNRLIRGVAKSITILSSPDQPSRTDSGSEGQKGSDSSSKKDGSGSGSQEKKSDQKD